MSGLKSGIRTARDTVKDSAGLTKMNILEIITKVLRRTLDHERQVSDSMKQELSLLENSRLNIHRRDGKVTFSCVPYNDNHPQGITRDIERVHRLARRRYLVDSIKAGELHMKRLQRIIDSADIAMLEARTLARLNKYAKAGLDLCHVLFTEEQNEWLDQPFTPNPFYQESLNYSTRGGVLVRSKSEAIIGNFLELAGLPYRYDDLVNIVSDNRSEAPFRDNYFADFKVPNLLGGITIHEHFGAFQIETYQENSLKRLNDYQNFTVIELPGRPLRSEEFTWSFERNITQSDELNKLLLKILLPGIYY